MSDNTGRWIRVIIFAVLLAATVMFLVSIGELVKILIISALLAYVFDPLAVFLEAHGISRGPAAVIIFSSIFGVIGISFVLLLPLLNSEISSIQEGLGSGQAAVMITKTERFIGDKFGFLGFESLDLTSKIHNAMVRMGDWTFNHLLDMVSLITNLVIMPFIAFFLLKDGREIKKQLISMVPNRYFEFSMNMLYKMDLQLGNYLRGQFLDAVIFGILSVFALWLLDIKFFLIIGFLAGLANLIPFLGPVVGAAPAIVISVLDTGGFTTALYVILAFAVMKLIDDTLIQPLVVARSVDTHPLLVLLAVLIGGKFFGLLGMVLSVPVTSFIKVALQEGITNFRKYRLT